MAVATQYWCCKKIVVSIKTGHKTIERVLAKPFAVIGRDPNCDLVLEDPELRGHLFYLHANEYGLYCTPINADAGSIPQGWLGPEDTITCGGFQLQARLEDQDNASGVPSPSWPRLAERGSTEPPLPVVAIYRKGKLLAKRRIRAQLTLLGRNQPSLIRIPSRSLSRCHCALFWEAGKLWFVDLKSRSHCWIEGLKRQAGCLDVGVRLQVGQYEIEYLGLEGTEAVSEKEPSAIEASSESEGHFEDGLADLAQNVPTSDSERQTSASPDAAEIQRLQQALREAQQEQDVLQAQLDEVGAISSRLEDQRTEFLELQLNHRQLGEENSRLKGELDARGKAAVRREQEVQEQTEALRFELTKALEASEQNADRYQEEAARLKIVEESVGSLNEQVETAQAQERVYQEEIARLQKKLSESSSLLEQRESVLQQLQDENREFDQLRQEWLQGAGESASQLSDLQEQLAIQKAAVKNAERRCQEIESDREELLAANQTLAQQLEKGQAQLQSLGDQEARCQNLGEEVASLQRRLVELTESSETECQALREQVKRLEDEVSAASILLERERQQAELDRAEWERERIEGLECSEELEREVNRVREEGARIQKVAQEASAELRESLEETKRLLQKEFEGSQAINAECQQLRVELREAQRHQEEQQARIEAVGNVQERVDQLTHAFEETRAVNSELLCEKRSLEEQLTKVRQELEARGAEIEAKVESFERERQDSAVELERCKEALKATRLELESVQARQPKIQKERSAAPASDAWKPEIDDRPLEGATAADEFGLKAREVKPKLAEEHPGPMVIPREQTRNMDHDYDVSELASRLSVFGRAKKGRWLWVRRIVISLAWFLALTLTGGLVYLIVVQLMQ
jgi:pSer/pThr/pTyr-binding forkhead associated (FHA) protein